MNGIKLLLLLAASAQVEAGTERDYGWAVNKDDGVLEYIVQINPDKKRAMETRSVQFPNGQENVSNMPRELVGRASRVVIRFGTEILPREPSLQELERTQRLFEQPSVSAAAALGEDKFRDLESSVRNIQSQSTTPVFPAIPNGLPGAKGQRSAIDQADQTANSLRNELNESLSSATADSTMPGRNLPDPGLIAQNMTNQNGGGFLNDTRLGAAGAGSKFNSTAQPASPLGSAATPPVNTPTKLPDFPASTGTNPPFASGNPSAINPNGANTNTRNPGLNSNLSANNSTSPLYPADRSNIPSLNNQTSLPQQRTPSTTFGSTPGLAGQSQDNWNTQNPTSPNYSPNASPSYNNYNNGQQNYPPNYTSAPNYGNPQDSARIAMNTPPYTPPANANVAPPPTAQTGGLNKSQMELALAVRDKLDKNKDGVLTPEEYNATSVDGIVLTLFVVSLLVNLYLGHLMRKLLMRYRVVLTNVRSQAAYT